MSLKQLKDFVELASPSAMEGLPPNATLMSDDYRPTKAHITFSGPEYKARLGRRFAPKYVSFDEWWCGEVLSRIIAKAPGRESIFRGEVLKYIRNEETGAHVAGKYRRGTADDKLARLMQGEHVDVYMMLNGAPPVMAEPHAPAYATLHQIGWEVEEMMKRMHPDLTARANFIPTTSPRLRPVPPGVL
ncbi:hypothetical protein [Methylobacterium sp. D54C]